ncbi:MAG TPA: glycosyl hydrolase family 18 protein, partial [Gemmatimonadaceae bacterium]
RLAAALLTLAATSPLHAQKLEALWYSVGRESSTQSFLEHADQISIVSPQVFFFDSLGGIRGRIDPRLVAKAREKGVKVVPLVMNPGFDQPMIHRILTNADARRRSISSMVALCRDNKFDGIQFDVENVHVSDKQAFTSWVRETADSLHRVDCSASAAVVPRSSEDRGPTSYHRWMFDNWRGVYDYKALADALDFISFMTYAQHTGGSPPGPVAGYTWMEECLEYVLSLGVPPAKISLGVPAYSDWWYPTYDDKNGSRLRGNDVSYKTVMDTLARRGVTPIWDDREKTLYAIWPHAGVNELAWIEDARAFSAKVELARKYGLRGYSVWVLGMEDPAVWSLPR